MQGNEENMEQDTYEPDEDLIKGILKDRRGKANYQDFVDIYLPTFQSTEPLDNALCEMKKKGIITYEGSFEGINPNFLITLIKS